MGYNGIPGYTDPDDDFPDAVAVDAVAVDASKAADVEPEHMGEPPDPMSAALALGVMVLMGVVGYWAYMKYARGDLILRNEAALKRVSKSLPKLRGGRLVPLNDEDEDAVVRLMVLSLLPGALAGGAKSSLLHWVVGDPASEEEARKLLEYWARFCVCMVKAHGGLLFGVRACGVVEYLTFSSGALLAVAAVCPPGTARAWDKPKNITELTDRLDKLGTPMHSDRALQRHRSSALTVRQMRTDNAAVSHYYVRAVCTLPAWQRRGFCAALMGVVSTLAAQEDAEVYIEAGGVASDCFARLGFEARDTLDLAYNRLPAPAKPELALELTAMVCRPIKSKTE